MPSTTTKTIKSSGGDYTSLSAWEAGQQKNCVTGDVIEQAECYSFADTAAVTIDGWTTDATRYIRIYTPSGERHDGKYNTSKYRLEVNGSNGVGAIRISEGFTRIEGLQIKVTQSTDITTYGIVTNDPIDASCQVSISANIIRGVVTGDSRFTPIWLSGLGSGAHTIKIYNNLIYDAPNGGYNQYSVQILDRWTFYIYNNTWADCYGGVILSNNDYGGTLPNGKLKNNLFSGLTAVASGTFENGTDYNSTTTASMGYTVTGGGNTHDRLSQTFTFVNSGADDFHLGSADAGAKDRGVDLSADANLAFSTDIDGTTRSGTWDIGADEITTAGDQSVTLPTISSGAAFNVPTLAYAMALPTITSGAAVRAPVLAHAVTLPTIASTQALNSPAVSPGAVSLALPTIASGAAANAPLLAYGVQLPTIGSSLTLNAPTIAPGSVALALPTIASSLTLNAPTVDPGAVTVDLPTITSTAQMNAPVLAYGMTLPTISVGTTLFAPSVANDGTLTLSTIASGASVNSPTVAPGAVTLDLPTIASGAQLNPPVLAYSVTLPTIASSAALTAPTIAFGMVLPTITAGSVVNSPSLAYGVSLPAIASSTTMSSPTLVQGVLLPTIASGSVTRSPALSGDGSLTLPTIATGVTVNAPSLAQAVLLPSIASAAAARPPVLAHGMTLPTIGSGASVNSPTLIYGAILEMATITSGVQMFPPSSVILVVDTAPLRTFFVPREDRSLRVPWEDRSLRIKQ